MQDVSWPAYFDQLDLISLKGLIFMALLKRIKVKRLLWQFANGILCQLLPILWALPYLLVHRSPVQ